MEGGDGMVAVVRGLRDAGLAVTVLDGCRRYTLMPNSVPHSPVPTQVHVTREVPECIPVTSDISTEPLLHCDSSAQATDGRYASMYKVAHCKLNPTSPPVQLTEFPPQRAELCPDHGNFEVGGTGSGEKYSPVKPTTQFRGGMSWPDRGSVCAPRPSYEPDSFANSLRKYPSMSPQRSSEMVERLVNYTQAKHSNKTSPRSRTSPTRLSECFSNHILDKDSRMLPTRYRCYEPEVTIRPRLKTDESPTREGRVRRCDHCPDLSGTAFCRNVEVRCLRDLSKRTRESARNLMGQTEHHHNQPYDVHCSAPYVHIGLPQRFPNRPIGTLNMKSTNDPCSFNTLERYDHHTDEPLHIPRRTILRPNRNSVHTESQAVVETMSREVATLPRAEPSKRNVAVPLSPISSNTQRCPQTQLAACPTLSAFKSVQTIPTNTTLKTRKSVQATSSSIELLSVNRWDRKERSERKSKSQEELWTRTDDFKKDVLQLLESLDCRSDEMYRAFRDELIRKIKKNKRRISFGIDGRTKSAPYWFKASCRHCVDNCRRLNKFEVFRTETRNVGVPNDESLQNVIKEWLHEIHMKDSDFLEVHSLDEIINSLAAKLRHLSLSSEDITKSQIMHLIEEVTFDASDSDRNVQMNNLAEALAKNIKNILHTSARKLSRYRQREKNAKNKKTDNFPFKKFIQPTEEEVRGLVREELLIFMDKFNLKLNWKSVSDVETEIIDVLIDSINELQWGNNDKVKEELAIALKETSKLPECYLKCLAAALVKRFKEFMHTFNAVNIDRVERQSYVVLQNTIQNTSKQQNETTDLSIEPITDVDIEAHIEKYTSQLTQVIESWWTSLMGADENEKGFREVAINDLAGDIVDRHRFLEMDTSKRWSDEEEVEYLKYQIFRWIHKLVGVDPLQIALDRAPDLMEQIQRIPVPMMRLPEDVARSKNTLSERPRTPAVPRSPEKAPVKSTYNINQLPMFGAPGRGGSLSENSKKPGTSARRMSGPASYSMNPAQNVIRVKEKRTFDALGHGGSMTQGLNRASPGRGINVYPNNPREHLNTAMPTLHEVNIDLDSYIHDWVNQIPIAANSPQEQEVADKLRLTIHTGVWKSLAKMQLDSAIFKYEAHIQAILQSELEDLLSSLPSSQELTTQKPLLKDKLIERIKNNINVLRRALMTTSYRHRLWNALTLFMPPRPKMDDRDKSDAHLTEEFLKLNITEDYVLFRLYQHVYKMKEAAYKAKLMTALQRLHENAKELPGYQIINPDLESFSFSALLALVQVETPDIEVLQDEANQIILGHEIAQWLQDLPIAQSYANIDQLHRRRLRDVLAKKIHDIEKQTNLCDNSAVVQLKNEFSKFIEKFSPRPEEAGNLSFLIDEFINRLKNRREEIQEPIEFGWFEANVALRSSITENIGPIGSSQRSVQVANQGPSGAGGSRVINKSMQRQQEVGRESQVLGMQPQSIPSCCLTPAAMSRQGPQVMSNHISRNEQTPYREPSNVQWLTMLNTQEQIQREKEALEAQAQQIPPCCQSVVAASQRQYGVMRPGGTYEPIANAGEGHTSQIPGPSYAPIAHVPRPEELSMHSDMRHLVGLQDQRQGGMPGIIQAAPGMGGVASFVQPSAQPIMQVPITGGLSRAPQLPGPSSGLSGPTPAEASEPCVRGTPVLQRSVRPRQIGSPQQILSSRSPINQGQFAMAAPLVQQEPVFVARHDLEEIANQNISYPALSPLDLSIRGPVGFSTPRQGPASPGRGGAPEIPEAPRARRKRTREGDAVRSGQPRRRLELEELEEEEERERDEVQCRCTERVYRCRRRRPMCCDCEDNMDYPRYYPMPYPYCFF